MLECPRCKGHRFWSLQGKRKRCKGCRLTRKFTKTIWDQTRISSYWKGRLIEYFCLGVPAYRLRFHVPLHAKTVERWFGILRKVIYEQTIKELQTFKGTIEMDETVFGGRRKGQWGWRAQDKHIVFGIYQRNGYALTFPITTHTWIAIAPLVVTHTATLMCHDFCDMNNCITSNGYCRLIPR